MSQSLEDFAATRKMEPGELLRKYLGLNKKQMMRPATHIGKYTHSRAKGDMSILCTKSKTKNGYLCFGNFHTALKDYTGNPAFLSHSKTLESTMQDDRLIWEHLEEGSPELRHIACVGHEEFREWQERFHEIKEEAKTCMRSNFKLKQVYFPHENGTYHLLTLLPCSLLIWELKYRIGNREWSVMETDKKEVNVRTSYIDHWNRKYGSTKPQNVSHLNSENGGNARVLTCLPPTLNRDCQPPKRNFFNQIKIYIPKSPKVAQQGLGLLFQSLYDTLTRDPNALWARKKKRGIIRAIIERGVIMPAEFIREKAPAGWSSEEKFSGLPYSQKAWLDPHNDAESEQTDVSIDWRDEIAEQISRFVCRTFERTIKYDLQKRNIGLIDEAFSREISDIAKEYLDG